MCAKTHYDHVFIPLKVLLFDCSEGGSCEDSCRDLAVLLLLLHLILRRIIPVLQISWIYGWYTCLNVAGQLSASDRIARSAHIHLGFHSLLCRICLHRSLIHRSTSSPDTPHIISYMCRCWHTSRGSARNMQTTYLQRGLCLPSTPCSHPEYPQHNIHRTETRQIILHHEDPAW